MILPESVEIVVQPWHTDDGALRLLDIKAERYKRWEGVVYSTFRRTFLEQAQRAIQAMMDAWDPSTGSAPESPEDIEKHVKPELLGARPLRQILDAYTRVTMRIFRVEGPAAYEFAKAAKPKPVILQQNAARPFGPYANFQECVDANQDKDDPEAYCAALEDKLKSLRQESPFSWQSSALQHIRRRENKIVGVNQTRWKAIRDTIERTWLNPKWDRGSRTMARELAREFSFDAVRSLRIARTESGCAANGAAYDGYGAAGAPYKGWLTAEDERVRETHSDQNGMIIRYDEVYPNGCKYPNDPDGRAEEVINCRCTLTPEFEPA